MLILHMSDWHGEWRPVPEADVYVCTGDMLYNYCRMSGRIDRRREIYNQAKETQQVDARQFLDNTNAPVVVVRGNHDFVPLSPLFRGGPVYEISEPEDSFVVEGVRFGGMRGINWIGGEWSDEIHSDELDARSLRLPTDATVLVTHSPPYGILDAVPSFGNSGWENCGVSGLSHYYMRRSYRNLCPTSLKLHCFGHIHESFGTKEEDVLFSNASLGYNLIEINKTVKVLDSKRCVR